ncbi:MAG: hypothetical protein AAGA08_05865 [Pseudomonadota bacterium]
MSVFAQPVGMGLYQPKCDAVGDLLDQIEGAETLDQVAASFVHFPREFGFDSASIVVLSEGKRRFLSRRVLTTLPGRYHDIYYERGFLKNNPIIERIRAGAEVCFYPRFGEHLTEDGEKTSFVESDITGLSGVACKLEFPSGLSAVVFLSTERKPPHNLHSFTTHRDDIMFLAYQFMDAFVYFVGVGGNSEIELTCDEVRFLRLAAISDDPEAARRHDYMYGSSETLQTSIARKLGIKSMFQAISIAVKRGLIDLDTLDRTEVSHSGTKLAGWDQVSLE